MADARPNLVKALLIVEAASSPFHELQFVGAPDNFKDLGLQKPLWLHPDAADLFAAGGS